MNSSQSNSAPTSSAPSESENPYVRFTQSAIHGTGGFAKCDIPSGTQIIEYVGERIDKAEAQRRCENDNRYIFFLDETWDIDGDVAWNPARFINHSCAPNCETEVDTEEGRVWVQTIRDITAGEELSFNYCYDMTDFEEHPCRCGTPECVGFIVAEEHFDVIRAGKKSPS